jgi:tetratricopeptide (TPR) repeat protein
VRRYWPLVRTLAPIVVLLALAATAALVARDAAAIRHGMERGDLAFEALPAAERLWRFETAIPYAEKLVGVEDDLIYRRALRTFAVDDRRSQNPYDFSRPAFRAEAQASLGNAQRSGLTPAQRSKLATLAAVLAFDEAVSDPVNGPNLIRQSLAHFQRAVRIDPSNSEAKYNLEFILRVLAPGAERLRIRQNIPAYSAGRSAPGAGPNRVGEGY